MTVEFGVLEYITHLGIAFLFGGTAMFLVMFAWSEAKKSIIRETKQEVRDR